MNKIKGTFNLVWLLIKMFWQELRKKRTWLMVAFIVWSYLVAWFNSNYYVQSPVKEWQPIIMDRYKAKGMPKKLTVVTVKASEIPKPTSTPPTEEQMVKGAKYGEELWNIYMLESTRGKNDGCRKEGKWGGFGVMSLGKVACYETFEKAVERASYWYEKIRKNNDLDTSLCIWNTGKAQPMCHYSMTYHTL